MMRRVLGMTLSSFLSYFLWQLKRKDLHALIEIEKKLDVDKYIDRSQVVVPKSFEDSFKDIYLEIHQKIKSGLDDKSLIDEALIEVFTDFLTRSGKTFEQLSDHHRAFLYDLCDLTVTRLNEESQKQASACNESAKQRFAVKNHSSSEDILNIIEQKLRV